MAVDIVMPNLGFDMQEARIVEWLKQPGEAVRRGEPIAVIESDKANVELESIAEGVLLEQLAQADDIVAVNTVIGRVGSPAEARLSAPPTTPAAPERAAAPRTHASPLAQRMAAAENVDLGQITGTGTRGKITRRDVERHMSTAPQLVLADGGILAEARSVRALPKVRKAARKAHVNLADVPPTGASGEVTLQDLEAYLELSRLRTAEVQAVMPEPSPTAPAHPDDAPVIELSRMRRTIGERLQQSMQDAPHFYVTGEFDLERALVRAKEAGVGVNDLIQYVTVQTLRRVPRLNATYHNGQLMQPESVHLAAAVALPDGLLTPVIPNAERYSLHGLATESRALIQRAREGRLQARDLQGGTFTISNLGVVKQVDHFTAVINPPQVAILAVGTVKPRPVVIEGGLHIRHTVHLTLSGDHRVVDGMHLAQFLAAFAQELERV
ncbi:MAG: dihydrolipoamide acetyltransferase family protein [Anaerolineae bacterium]